jgi:hypothetical protein
MIIAIPFRALWTNQNSLRSQPSPEIQKAISAKSAGKKKRPKIKKAHSLRVGRIFLIRISLTETPPATRMSGP